MSSARSEPERTPLEPEWAGYERDMKEARSSQINWYFFFICASTAFRSYEAGIISINVPDIQKNMGLNFVDVGMISASPDYGIVPSGLIAALAFNYLPAYSLLTRGYFLIAVVSFLCFVFPTFWMLITARALSGFCWGFAAVHYPAWINKWAPQEKRTIWLGVFNVMLLMGILIGYVVGAVTRSAPWGGWEPLYCSEGVLMLFIAAAGAAFDPDLVQVVDFNEKVVIREVDPEAEPLVQAGMLSEREKSLWLTWFLGEPLTAKLPKGLIALYLSNIYFYALMIGSLMAGTVGFVLYFITSFQTEVMTWDPAAVSAVTAFVFIVGPVGGVILGAVVLTRLGGYQNLVNSFTLTVISSCFVLLSGIALHLFSSYGKGENIMVTAMVWSYLFSGAVPTAACNGICVNIVPGTSHIASGVQFFTQNAAKLIIPSISGKIIDRIGIVAGFNATLITTSSLAVLFSMFGYREAFFVGSNGKSEDDL